MKNIGCSMEDYSISLGDLHQTASVSACLCKLITYEGKHKVTDMDGM